MQHLRKHIKLLETLAHVKPSIAKSIIKKCDKYCIKSISELALNTLRGNIELNSHDSQKLRKYRKQLHLLANKRTSVVLKKRTLQKGGFLPALLATVVPIIAGLIQNSIQSQRR